MDIDTQRLLEQLRRQLAEQLKMIKNHEIRIRHLQQIAKKK